MKQTPDLLLIGESFSPWIKKARWALEHCGLGYDYKEYIPTLSELGLRLKLKQATGQISVPILFADKEVYRGSWNIACYANDVDGAKRLGDMDVISAWDALSEDALAEGRTRVVRAILNNKRALEEGMPSFIPTMLRRPLRFIARDAVKRLDRKYAHLVKPGSMRNALDSIRTRLKQSSSNTLLDHFSYADITMAVILELIKPIATHQPPLGPVTQELWNDSALAEEYLDLIEWRNALAMDRSRTYSQFNQQLNDSN